MLKLSGKTAVVTGGNSGIGLAIATRFAAEGASVFIFGRREAELQHAIAQIGPNATAVRGDVTDPADLDRLYETVRAEKGGLDVIATSAGIFRRQMLSDTGDRSAAVVRSLLTAIVALPFAALKCGNGEE